ncbi:type II toxin-antitoxin system HipA family toxin [Caulobacter sp. SL161]|uniref:type II toxin-antitoxin system HipA family toxin n=1 Tax=Caulobacter sp. SL161 TaxID=2995156 RepID=UPI002276E486|nr:type II toxin-antitoxin system HipA family toxin [Caulobacter sp. SL161]MCY1649152.1 type II toxin-antitoxin system HipA family toxin [Caulobacter sp. SL161]
MARRRLYTPLAVYLNGRRVGLLRRAPDGAIDFTYGPDWLSTPNAIPVSLSMPLREDRYVGAPVIAVFDNLLPDNETIRGRIAAKVRAEGVDLYSLLAALGRDCVGALQFLPEGVDVPAVGAIDGEAVSDADIERILANLARAPLGIDEGDDFRISIAGAQEKTAFLRHSGQWLRPLGTTPTTHIFKPQIGQLPNGLDLSHSVENEYFCLTLMRALGLRTANVAMAMFGAKQVLIIERFDRFMARDGRLLRTPQEDFCQALSIPWARKYESDGGPGVLACLGLLAASDEAKLDRLDFLKAQIVFWLLAATDGHAKNFSAFHYPGGGFRMTPLYDVLSAEPSRAARQIEAKQMKLAMAIGDHRHYRIDDIAPRHFVQSSTAAGLNPEAVMDVFTDLLATAPVALEGVLSALPSGFPAAVSQPIAAGFLTRLGKIRRYLDGLADQAAGTTHDG